MYTIKEAAARTGLAVPTIRAWERRYGIVSPSRTAAGYRLYDDAALERLSAMRSLVETGGWRPSQAAEHVVALGSDLSSVAGRPTLERDPTDPSRTTGATSEVALAAFVEAARELDIDVLERILDDAFAAQRFELAMDDVVFPALRAIGRAWAAGDLDVAAEHAASETVRRRLARFFDAARTPSAAVPVLVGMPPGGRHELGAFAFAVACRRAGQAVTYLGMDVPLSGWLRSARETGTPAIVLGAVTSDDVGGVDAVVDAVRTLDRPPICFTGGGASLEATSVSGAVRLPSGLDEAVRVVEAATAQAEGRTRAR